MMLARQKTRKKTPPLYFYCFPAPKPHESLFLPAKGLFDWVVQIPPPSLNISACSHTRVIMIGKKFKLQRADQAVVGAAFVFPTGSDSRSTLVSSSSSSSTQPCASMLALKTRNRVHSYSSVHLPTRCVYLVYLAETGRQQGRPKHEEWSRLVFCSDGKGEGGQDRIHQSQPRVPSSVFHCDNASLL